MTTQDQKLTGLALMRAPFPANQISKLPKPTKAQTDAVRNDFKVGIRCQICGTWHHPQVVHLDYVGHAALTDRLLDCDPNWNWEPVTESGLPALDQNCGMWIKLTVCGVTRLGYGHAETKKGGDAIKEVIGDALRNAAMRFGAALDLWHKGDLHGEDQEPIPQTNAQKMLEKPSDPSAEAIGYIAGATDLAELQRVWGNIPPKTQAIPAVIKAKDDKKVALQSAPILESEIPY